MTALSVLMSIYIKEKPEYVDECFQSLLRQTIPADEWVVVEDGPLTKEMYDSMSIQEQEDLARSIAKFLKELHSLPLPDIDDLELDVIEDYKGDYESLKELIYNDIPKKSQEYLDSLFKRILSDERITMYERALCHNDLSCNHIIMHNNRVVGIIDFGDVAVTDRDKDFIYLLENQPSC